MAEADYIIIGGGTAGCVIAARLAKTGASVLLLEAGGRDRSPLFRWPAGFAKMTKGMAGWGWSTAPQRHLNGRALWFTQAKVIGGGSSINAQIYTRGNRRDYDAWAQECACPGWSYQEVLPYFRRSEYNERFADDYHGGEGPLHVSQPKALLPICEAFVRAGQEWGMPYNPDFNGKTQAGVGFYQLTQRNARRDSVATAYLRPAERHHNLTVLINQSVHRILISGHRAGSVEMTDGVRHHARSEIIVTSGAIGSPRLLMLSGLGPADHLRQVGIQVVHDLPGVGGNLQDHLNLCVLAECTGPHSYDGVLRWDRMLLAGLQYALFRSGPVAASLFETGGFWHVGADAEWPDMQFHLGQGSGIEKGIAAIDGWGITLNSAYTRPRSRGSVRLASADPAAAPLIDPNYWSDPHDREMSLRGLSMARALLSQPALKPYLRREILPGLDKTAPDELFEYACRMAKTDHHPVGTCRMGSDAMAVVDPELRVCGIDGLRVCDASIMPRINSSNTNAPTLMIAEKASDLIAGLPPPGMPDAARHTRPHELV